MRISILLLLIAPSLLFAQPETKISRLILSTDTLEYSWPQDAVVHRKNLCLPFFYDEENEVCEIRFWTSDPFSKVKIIPSGDYDILDSLVYTGDYYRFKVNFHHITRSEFLKLSVSLRTEASDKIQDIHLQPFTETSVRIFPKTDELFIGEESIIEIVSNNPENIMYNNEWTENLDIDYRITEQNGTLQLHLLPNRLGSFQLEVPVQTRKPYLTPNRNFRYVSEPIAHAFNIKASRLQFLGIDKKELTLDESSRREGIEVQFDDSRMLQMNKTYRIEDQEEPGGALIAEIFTRRRLGNNKVLCIIRPYNYHRQSEGYLYIKDGDKAWFISNFSITHATTIENISILREDGTWKSSGSIFPGETIEVRLEGKGLHKGKFHFEGLHDITRDSLTRNEFQSTYTLQVPVDIPLRSVNIYNFSRPTGHYLQVKEYQKPRDFDYLYMNYGDMNRKISALRGPIMYENTIKDITFSFNNNKIDEDKLYGTQYVDIDVRVTGKKNELVEMRTIKNITICPGDRSPRNKFYAAGNCSHDDVSLNKYLSRKTYDLDEWSKISLTIRNNEDEYDGEGYQKEIEIILKRRYSFDVEVSFPAGLITISKQDSGDVGFGSLSGISMAMIGQFSFYHPEKFAKYRPYKIGAGFLALNAFNFSDDADNRDVGLVILGSLYPTTRDVKLTFPLYIGGGYLLKDQKWFFLIGPGIRVKL